VPPGSLKFLLAAGYNAHNVTGGFASLAVRAPPPGVTAPAILAVAYLAPDNTVLYEAPLLLPRTPVTNAAGRTIAMAAPDYAAAGLPRPSDALPAGAYSATSSDPRGTADHAPEPLPLFAAHGTSVSSNDSPFQATLWLYAPTAGNATWAAWYNALQAHAGNVTGAAPCLYLMGGDGVFTTQMPNASATAMARGWTARMGLELGLKVRPLLAASGSGMNLILQQPVKAAAFIAATVAEAKALGLAGYNVQLEEPGNATIAKTWLSFLSTWLDVAAPLGVTLSIIIGGDCRQHDWMFVECGDYRVLGASKPNLRVITEATYVQEPAQWKDYLTNIVRGLSPAVAAPGVTYGPVLDNPGNGCLPAAAAAGVRELYVWVDLPTEEAAWDALGWWVSGAALAS
jgi:hypothetical protein